MKKLLLSLAVAGTALTAAAPAFAYPHRVVVVERPRGWVGAHYFWHGRHYHHRRWVWDRHHHRHTWRYW